ncbi:hypothetical protein PYCC9005_003550 [Savitreella phatthalungensis]
MSVLLVCSLATVFARTQEVFTEMDCPDYQDHSTRIHNPLSRGPIGLPFQRPSVACRTFRSEGVERLIEHTKSRIRDPDLARLFENCFPNTLDTTVRWHDDALPETFVITGDINAMWLRDSTFQLEGYHDISSTDMPLARLIAGVVQTQAKFLLQNPYCNAFQPPRASGLKPVGNNFRDTVEPAYDPDVVFECKYEIDSIASFLHISWRHWQATADIKMFTPVWIEAVEAVMRVISEQSQPSFDVRTGKYQPNKYTWRRQTDSATETLALDGSGFPVAANTSLVRSAFRPSDDASVLQFLIPANAFLAVELDHLSNILETAQTLGINGASKWVVKALEISKSLHDGINKHGVVEHAEFGRVFAYEVDGFGSRLHMDDANTPSLLGLPLLGFVNRDDVLYKNTRRLVLSKNGNPWFVRGAELEGVGSPHTPPDNVWPMSIIVRIMTSDDEIEIRKNLDVLVRTTGNLGLMHESINAWNPGIYTRPWFAWANALFGQMIVDLLDRFPQVLS